MRWIAWVVLLGVACGDEVRWAEPGVADEEPPVVESARLVELEDGGVRVEVVADDPGSCGVGGVQVVLSGSAFAFGGVELALQPEPGRPGTWSRTLSPDRCGRAGSVGFGQIVARDRGGNQRDFRKVLWEDKLQATDRLDEILLEPARLEATRDNPSVLGVRAEQGAGGELVVVVEHDGRDCGVSGAVEATGPGWDRTLVELTPERATPTSDSFVLADPSCLAGGTWTVTEVWLGTTGDGGVFLWANPEDDLYVGAEDLPVARLELEGGDGLSLSLQAVSLEPNELTAGWGRSVWAEVVADPAGCGVASARGRLRRLPTDHSVGRFLPFDDEHPARVSSCSPPGRWWLYDLTVVDASRRWHRFSMLSDRPEEGFSEAPDVPPAALLLQ